MKIECFDIEGTLLVRKNSNKYNPAHPITISDSKFSLLQNSARLAKIFSFLSLVEIKLNNFMRLVYSTSLYEIGLFLISIFLFVSLPSYPLHLLYFLIVILHLLKAAFGLILLNILPKTYQVCEHFTYEITKSKDYEEKDLIANIKASCKDILLSGLFNSKCWLNVYFVFNLIAISVTFGFFCIYYYTFSDSELLLLESSVFLMLIILFVGSLLYFFWFATIGYSFSEELAPIIQKAIVGQTKDLEDYINNNL